MSIGRRRESGAARELEDAREALLKLGYTVVTVENPNAGQLEAALDAHREADWAAHASSVVALMAHGHAKRIECQARAASEGQRD